MKASYLLLVGLLLIHSTSSASTQPGIKVIQDGTKRLFIPLERMTLEIDARLEALTVLQALTHFWGIDRDSSQYLSSIEKHFGKFRNHNAVRLLSSFYQKGIWEEVPYETFLALDYNFSPKQDIVSPKAINIQSDIDTAKLFIREVQRFARESHFDEFFKEQIPYYSERLQTLARNLERFDDISAMEALYGETHESSCVILLPLDYASKGIVITRTSGSKQACVLYGLGEFEGSTVPSRKRFTSLLWHEMGHTFVNHITYDSLATIHKYQYCYAFLTETESLGYPTWDVVVNEQIVRGASAYGVERTLGEEASKSIVREEEREGFLFTNCVRQSFLDFHRQRSKYKSFRDFLPTLMMSFDTTSAKKERRNFIPALRSFTFDSSIVIYPSNENHDAADSVMGDVQSFYNRKLISRHCSLMPDTAALRGDLRGKRLVIIGSYFGNKYLAHHKKELPFGFNPQGITLDTLVARSTLALVTSWYNPADPDYPAIILTSNRSSNIIGLLDRFPTFTTNFVLFDGRRVLDYGAFTRVDDRWRIDPN